MQCATMQQKNGPVAASSREPASHSQPACALPVCADAFSAFRRPKRGKAQHDQDGNGLMNFCSTYEAAPGNPTSRKWGPPLRPTFCRLCLSVANCRHNAMPLRAAGTVSGSFCLSVISRLRNRETTAEVVHPKVAKSSSAKKQLRFLEAMP